MLCNSFTTLTKHVQLMHTLKHHTTLNNSSYSSFGPRHLAQSSATSVFVNATFPHTLPRALRAVAECTPRVWADPSSLCFHKTPCAAQRLHRTPALQCKLALAMSHPDWSEAMWGTLRRMPVPKVASLIWKIGANRFSHYFCNKCCCEVRTDHIIFSCPISASLWREFDSAIGAKTKPSFKLIFGGADRRFADFNTRPDTHIVRQLEIAADSPCVVHVVEAAAQLGKTGGALVAAGHELVLPAGPRGPA